MRKLCISALMLMTMGGMYAQDESWPLDINPQDGATLETLSEMILTINEEFYYDYDSIMVYSNEVVVKVNGEIVDCEISSEGGDWEDPLVITFSPAIETSGECEVIFPDESVWWGYFGNCDYPNHEVQTIHYTLIGIETPDITENLPFTVNPNVGSTINSMETIMLTLKDDEDNCDYEYLDIDSSEEVYFAYNGEYYCGVTSEAGYRELGITPELPFIASGEYALVFTPYSLGWGIFSADDVYNDETIELAFNYIAPPVTFDLEAEVTASSDLKTFTLTFTSDIQMVEGASAALIGASGNYNQTANFEMVEDGVYTVSFEEEPMQVGDYIFYVNQGQFGDASYLYDNETGVANAEIALTYCIDCTSVNMVKETGEEVIYDINGVKLTKGTEALPSGMYIVNGKKVMVK